MTLRWPLCGIHQQTSGKVQLNLEEKLAWNEISLRRREKSTAPGCLNLQALKTLFCQVLKALFVVPTSEPLHMLCALPRIIFPFSTEMLPLQRHLLNHSVIEARLYLRVLVIGGRCYLLLFCGLCAKALCMYYFYSLLIVPYEIGTNITLISNKET